MVGLVTGREEDSRVPKVAYGWLCFALGDGAREGRVELVGLGFVVSRLVWCGVNESEDGGGVFSFFRIW